MRWGLAVDGWRLAVGGWRLVVGGWLLMLVVVGQCHSEDEDDDEAADRVVRMVIVKMTRHLLLQLI